jgi:hypothetical protein
MASTDNLIEVAQYSGEGYQPLIEYGAWRVAVLRYSSEADEPELVSKMQRHNETDEVFVLIQGKCILFLGEGEETITKIIPVDMEPLKFYSIKQSVWHAHIVSKDAAVVIVENADTSLMNSPLLMLNDLQKEEIVKFVRELWG